MFSRTTILFTITILLGYGFLSPAWSQPKLSTSSTKAKLTTSAEEKTPTVLLYEHTLFNLVEQLHRKGLYRGARLQTAGATSSGPIDGIDTLWTDIDFKALEEAIDLFFIDSRGGLLTPRNLFSSEYELQVELAPESGFQLFVFEESQYYPLRGYQGIYECEAEELLGFSGEALLNRIGMNLDCFLVKYLRDHYRWPGQEVRLAKDDRASKEQQPHIFSREVFEDISPSLQYIYESYLTDLKTQGLIEAFEVDVSNHYVSIQLSDDPSGYTHSVIPQTIVNEHRTPEQERLALLKELEFLLFDSLIYVPSEQIKESTSVSLLVLSIAELKIAVSDAAQVARGELARQSFLEALGSYETGDLDSSGCQPSGISYDTGVVTPANNEAALFVGPDMDWKISLDKTLKQSTLGTDYHFRKIHSRDFRKIKNGSVDRKLCPLVKSQILVIRAHGHIMKNVPLRLGSARRVDHVSVRAFCSPDISADDTLNCCEYQKTIARGLGLNTDNMNCRARFPDRYTGEGSLNRTSSGLLNCDAALEKGAPGNRCALELDLNNLFSGAGVWGEKAAVITNTCYGGQLTSEHLPAVMDLVTFSDLINYNSVMFCEGQKLAQDLSGESQYCALPDGEEQEPFDGKVCASEFYPDASLVPTAPFSLRTIQGSINRRGATRPSYKLDIGKEGSRECNAFMRPHFDYTAEGLESYVTTQIGGNRDTAVEFRPSVSEIHTHQAGSDFVTTFDFTSKIFPDLDAVEIDFSIKPFYSDRARFSEPVFEELRLEIPFSSENQRIAGQGFWSQTPESLEDFYGVDHEDWRWFVNIGLEDLEAPSGVGMIGNEKAIGTLLYTDHRSKNTPAWKLFNGMEGSRPFLGQDRLAVSIPAIPAVACCKPLIEADGEEWVQNGCECRNELAFSQCRTTVCKSYETPDESGWVAIDQYDDEDECFDAGGDEFVNEAGEFMYDTQCCTSKLVAEGHCDERISEELTGYECPDGTHEVACEPGQGRVYKREYHHKIEAPFDLNEPTSCDAIEYRRCCERDHGAGLGHSNPHTGDPGTGLSTSQGGSGGGGGGTGLGTSTGTGGCFLTGEICD